MSRQLHESHVSTESGHTEPGATERGAELFDTMLKKLAGAPPPAFHSERQVLPPGTMLANGRFQLLSCIGRGGMGVVYAATDQVRSATVALKTLSRSDGASLYGLKNEFRTLENITHPNLVRLHELFADGDRWFFTMDLIEGEPLDTWVRSETGYDEQRLRDSLGQLLAAVSAIHRAGKLHRDLKPSNVLVTPTGHVFVLDFGLAADPQLGGIGQTVVDSMFSGTPAYMAPEQAAGRPATASTDLYAIGVMLFQSLAGRLPFSGSAGAMLAAKQTLDAPDLRADAGNLPSDLVSLCTRLLHREPEQRPRTADLEWILGSRAERSSYPSPPGRAIASVTKSLFGREAELAALRSAYAATLGGKAVVVVVSGQSGLGKSALCEAFLAELRAAETTVVFAGRCYERESIPFKALDPIIDDVSRFLRRLSNERVAALMPRHAGALAQLFPVLGRIDAVTDIPAPKIHDPHELQRRALAAFLELLGRIRDRRPLVISLDDLQWIDSDSVKCFRQMLVSRTPIPVMLLVSHQTGNGQEHPGIQRLSELVRAHHRFEFRQIALGPLDNSATAALAGELLSGLAATFADQETSRIASAIADEAGGNPFFAQELAQFVRQMGSQVELGSLSLGAVLSARVALLPESARRLLQALAIAGQPIAAEVALTAAGAKHRDIDELRSVHLVVSSEAREPRVEKLLECYHDRIRASVSSALSPEARVAGCEALARALSTRADTDPELLSRFLEGANDHEGAAHHAELAADRAVAALAFDHSVSLYEKALALRGKTSVDCAHLKEKLGYALENAGRGTQAAAAYQQAAALTSGEAAIDLRRRAAEQLIVTGSVDEGVALAKAVCNDAGFPFPTAADQPPVIKALLGKLRTKLQARFPWRSEPSTEPVSSLLLRIADSTCVGLNRCLPLQSAIVARRYLTMATDAKEPRHLVRALGLNVFIHAARARGKAPQIEGMISQMDRVAEADGRPELLGFAALIHGVASYHQNSFGDARPKLRSARQFLAQCAGVAWEIEAAHVHDQLAAHSRGDFADIAREAPFLIEQALLHGRFWTAAMMSGYAGMPAWISHDDVRGYRTQVADMRKFMKPRAQPQWPDYTLLIGEALLTVYEGNPEAGFDLIEAHGAAYGRATVTTASSMASMRYAACRGACAVSALRASALRSWPSGQMHVWQAALNSSLKTLRSNYSRTSTAIADQFEAARAMSANDIARATTCLEHAVVTLEGAELGMCAAAARRRLGQIVGGERGRQLVEISDAAMRVQGIRNLESMTELLCPGMSPA